MHRQGNTNIPDRDDCKPIVAGCLGCEFACQVNFFEIADGVVTDNIVDTETQCDVWPVPATQFRSGKLCLTAPHLADKRQEIMLAKAVKKVVRVGQQKQK